MEPASIDWKNIKSVIIKDDLYENIDAPKWVDFAAIQENPLGNSFNGDGEDVAFFCKPDCRHPRSVEDFKAREVMPLGSRSCRDTKLKRRAPNMFMFVPSEGDQENENPNMFLTPPKSHNQNRPLKIKSSAENIRKNKQVMGSVIEDLPRDSARGMELNRTMSSRSMGVGREIFNHIAEFCNELKKMALRLDEKENQEKFIDENKVFPADYVDENSGNNEKVVNKLPVKGKCEDEVKSVTKGKHITITRKEGMENMKVSVDTKKAVGLGGGNSLPVRTNPPSPQCFSGSRGPLRPIKTTPLRPCRPKPAELGVLQEQDKILPSKESKEEAKQNSISVAFAFPEAKSVDMFWFLNPCTTALFS